MSLLIRPAMPEDCETIAYIEKLCFSSTEAAPLESIRERQKLFTHTFLVACLDTTIVGFINGCVTQQPHITDDLFHSTALHDDQAPTQMVFSLAVHPEYQHQGIAIRLMHAFIEIARMNKKKRLTLTCKKERIPFYEQFGYINEGLAQSTHGGSTWYNMTIHFPENQ